MVYIEVTKLRPREPYTALYNGAIEITEYKRKSIPNNGHHRPSALKKILMFKPRRCSFWTDDDLNRLALFRAQNLTYTRIQKHHFPSRTKRALDTAYSRIPKVERIPRALAGASLLSSPHKTRRRERRQETRKTKDLVSPTAIHESKSKDNTPLRNPNPRYNLRPILRVNLREGGSQCLVDRLRFPHFYESYKDCLADTTADDYYDPPSHSPTPDLSDYSYSITSDQPSPASSTDLFGLEVRSPTPEQIPDTPSQCNDISDSEFFSTEEHLPSP
jgi:hypothetical protein